MDRRGQRGGWADFQTHSFGSPSAELAPFVEHYWAVRWDLRGQEPFRQLLPPHVNVHLSYVGSSPGAVRGPARRFSHRALSDVGEVFGVAFRPGAFRPFLDGPVSSLAGRSVAAAAIFGRDGAPTPDAVESLLLAREPVLTAAATSARDAVELIASEPALTRVEALAARLDVGVRSLQRLFAEHVGLGPKWCIRRYRLAEVTSRLESGADVDWAALAAELGYADQAHLSRDFTAILGEPPSRYALRYPSGSPTRG
ncbi:helix-turn-helix domain-containing protein [Cryptosporangium arvum]|uniref:DNA-binding domain-containing protein, AraC-type n=1 Tax=Cryptosporangium arvum DSM 44712 TaxID=927661 RepID=A0A011ACS3_9ACTN|nr:helix-turn-helix domain-containing protein [Cryptosporangium arvum]EXG79841.1 DNA-binding domain-containing protein, AraC-type [Cryptosporangium arvum DSM 44712]